MEQKWILFGSEGLTALRIRQVLGPFAQSQKASIAFIISVCLTVKYQCGSHWTDRREICMGGFKKICRKKSKID